MIYYIAYYNSVDDTHENRSCALSAVNKINYISQALAKSGTKVQIISPSPTANNTWGRSQNISIGNGIRLKLFRSLPYKNNLLLRSCRLIMQKVQLLSYFICHVPHGSTVVVYHSLGYSSMLPIIKRLKHLRMIMEIEEIYADVTSHPEKRNKELRVFNLGDGYLFSTELLDQTINLQHKPSVINYGTYLAEPDRYCKFNDGRIHCVYAGTFDPRKGGAAAAAAAAEFLDERYHVHIIGFGNEAEKKQLIDKIEEIQKKTKCKVSYDGLFAGEDYIRFLQSCDIGLSTQTPDAAFNDTSFPSKVLSYLSNGLQVVSVRIKALSCSAVKDALYFYNENTPEAIANAIMQVDFARADDSRKLVARLDRQFVKDIRSLTKEVKKSYVK